MALIRCSECGKQVSDKAGSCPQCGAPIASAVETEAAGAKLRTKQLTSKRLKVQIIISSVLFWGGIIWMIVVGSSASRSGVPPSRVVTIIAILMIFTGLVWYVVTRLRIWWHHK
jgi:uncharacterized membrane protein YvbJ